MSDPRPPLSPRARRWFAVVAGLVAGVVTLGVAELVAVVLGASSPFLDVGSLVIDLAPPGVKEAVIGLVGTGDKIFIGVVLAVVVAALAVAVGLLESRRPPLGVVLLGLVAVIAIVAATTRVGAGTFAPAPAALGAVAGIIVLRHLMTRLRAWSEPLSRSESLGGDPRGLERRGFLRLAVGAGVIAATAGVVARAVGAGARAVQAARDAFTLPAAATRVAEPTASEALVVDGLSPWIVPNDEFYRIDIALQVPAIDPASWSLRIHGMVENEITLTWHELIALPLEEHYATLACVSNYVGGDLIGNARWLGYPIRALLARAKPLAGADMALSSGPDGFTAGTPLTALQDEKRAALLAIGMNGEPLPIEHGFPARMVVPGLYGYVSATKWVTDIEITRFADAEGYWTPRGWSALGPVKLASRIDTPTSGASAGDVVVAGVAWAQHTGVSKVEVQIDDGEWAPAQLAKVVTVDSWLQWTYPWAATSGSHTLRVRATDANGALQVAAEAPPAPDGATGYHEVQLQVS